MTPLPRTFLLDLDDTILDDSSHVVDCWRETCERHAGELNGIAPAALHESIERTRKWYWGDAERHRLGRLEIGAARREVVRQAFRALGVEADMVADRLADHYGEQRDLGMRPIEGAIETVRWLRARGCRLALITNGASREQRAKITRFALAEHFDEVLIEGEVGYGKPDPRVYRLALDRLGSSAQDTWMAGDNLEWDVAAPQRQGIRGIWIDRRGRGLPEGSGVRPDRTVRRLAELREETMPSGAQPV